MARAQEWGDGRKWPRMVMLSCFERRRNELPRKLPFWLSRKSAKVPFMNGTDHLAVDPAKAKEGPDAQRGGSATRRQLHPLSGGVILLLDWLLFGSNAVSGFIAAGMTSLVGFVLAGAAVAVIQRKLEGDSLAKALVKALLAAVIVAVPLPIGGTVVGSIVLAISGLGFLRKPKLGDARQLLERGRRQ